ncbi:unnamed protein product, partial [Symbiodinium pilosum]
IAAGEKSAQQRGWEFETTCLSVLKKNFRARSCYRKVGFSLMSEDEGSFPTEGGDPECWHTMTRSSGSHKRAASSELEMPAKRIRSC